MGGFSMNFIFNITYIMGKKRFPLADMALLQAIKPHQLCRTFKKNKIGVCRKILKN
jgi:hypothetical protein